MLIQKKRGAVELSINTIVIVVIGITLLTLGLKWIYDIFGGIGDQTQELQRISQAQIQDIFGESDASISAPRILFETEQGDTLKIDIYLRNTITPGGDYSLQYTITPLAMPSNVQPTMLASKLNWYDQAKQLKSGDAYRDIVLFDTSNLPLGTYKFEATVTCVDTCSLQESTQFIVDLI